MAGIYRVQHFKKQGLEEERFAVHVDPRESNLVAADRGVIETLLESKPADGAAAVAANGISDGALPSRKGEVWPMILLGLLVMLGVETWLAFSKDPRSLHRLWPRARHHGRG